MTDEQTEELSDVIILWDTILIIYEEQKYWIIILHNLSFCSSVTIHIILVSNMHKCIQAKDYSGDSVKWTS